ncbi:sensor histidine kinase (plasmid) [Streptomyces sp. NBC_00440]|uniref:sensor histidine kinase n=1 Tax=unclassified Streptomyces TaxID=2593676 RepID=UPI002E1C2569|nr:sensor histidine kinase [Streptomyces sp. NBC_00963]
MQPTAGPQRRLDGIRRRTAFLTAGIPLQLISFWLALAVVPVPSLTALQRHRFRAMLDLTIPSATARAAGPWGVRERLASPVTQRQLGYHLVVGPLVAVGMLAVLALWAVSCAAATALLWIWVLPPEWRIDHRGYLTKTVFATGVGLLLLLGTVRLTGLLVRMDAYGAAQLLGPSRTERMRQRMESLSESRDGVVDAADLERRRIERDLHDGAQQRLVSLAVNLGIAKATFKDLQPDVQRVIDDSHREAIEAITELQDLVRGLHPAVLEDRGLDAALSGLAARAPIPVRLVGSVRPRPSPAVEAVAYYVVSEALTNIVKHARATQVDVRVEREADIMSVTVTDDGIGGVDPSGGTGLTGLIKRVASVDGTLSIDSPVGGPTTIIVELPCAR